MSTQQSCMLTCSSHICASFIAHDIFFGRNNWTTESELLKQVSTSWKKPPKPHNHIVLEYLGTCWQINGLYVLFLTSKLRYDKMWTWCRPPVAEPQAYCINDETLDGAAGIEMSNLCASVKMMAAPS